MDLYIANCSKQDYDFIYLLVERPTRVGRPHPMVKIPAGQQKKITDLTSKDIEATIEYIRRYGAREVSELNRNKGEFVGLIYSENEIVFEKLARAAEQNNAALDKTGKELREAAAIVADQSMLSQSPEGTTLKATHVETVEVSPKDRPDTETIAEQREVRPAPNDQRQDRRGKQRPDRVGAR